MIFSTKLRLPPFPVTITSLSVAAALLGDAMLYVVMPSRPELWYISIFQVGILLSANRLVRLFTNPASSYIVARFGVYQPFQWSLLASLSVLVAYAFTSSFTLLLLARLAWGACWSTLRLVSQWIASDQSDETNVGFNLASNASLIRIGSIGGALFGGILSDYIGYKLTFSIFGALTILSWLVWRNASSYRSKPIGEHLKGERHNFLALLKNLDILLIGMSGLAIGLVINGLMSASLGHFIRSSFGTDFSLLFISFTVTAYTGLMLGFRSFSEVFVGPFGGYISDRYGRLKVLVISVVLSSVGLLLVGATDDILFTTIMLALIFAAGVLLMMQLLPLVSVVAEQHSRSGVFSVYNTFQDFGSALGPLVGLSLVSTRYLSLLYQSSSVLLIILVLLLVFQFRRRLV